MFLQSHRSSPRRWLAGIVAAGACLLSACSTGSAPGGKADPVNMSECINCLTCAENCPQQAITVAEHDLGVGTDVDGGEGGTGAAPLEFTDHIGVPLQEVFSTLVLLVLFSGSREGHRYRVQFKTNTPSPLMT